jgi:hypothetical protein
MMDIKENKSLITLFAFINKVWYKYCLYDQLKCGYFDTKCTMSFRFGLFLEVTKTVILVRYVYGGRGVLGSDIERFIQKKPI